MKSIIKLVPIALAILLTGCGSPLPKAHVAKVATPHRLPAHEINHPSDTLTVSSVAAVFTEVSSAEIAKRKKKYGIDDFYTGADDDVFYRGESRNYLEKQHIRIIDAQHYKVLKFVRADKTVELVKPDTLVPLFNLYLFDPAKTPLNADMTAIEVDYKKYFDK